MGPLLVLVSLLSAPAVDDVGPPRLEIVVEQDGDCLVVEDLERGIAETLALDEQPPPMASVAWRIEVQAHARENGFAAAIAVRGEHGVDKRRSLEIDHDPCRELRDAVVLVSALLIDELWAENRTLHPRLSQPAAPVQAKPAAPVPAPTQPRTAPRPRWTVLSSALGLMTVGDLPRVAGGVGLRVGFDAPRVIGFQLSAIAWPRRETRGEDDVGARFAAYELGLALCPRALTRARLELVACAGARAGATHARGLGLDTIQASTRPRALIDVAFAVRVRVGGPVWLGAGAGAGIALVRDRFVYFDAGAPAVVHRAWPVVPVFELSLAVRSELPRPGPRRARSRPAARSRPF